MTDLTPGAICARHPGKASAGTCDRCGKSFCGECRVEDVAAERVYCSDECRNAERATRPDTRTDDALLQGYSHPILVGARSWARSLGPVTAAVGPIAGGAAVLTLLFGGFAAKSGPGYNSPLLSVLVAVGIFGAALAGVVTSRSHTGHAGSHAYLHTLQRLVPWTITWMLMMGVTVIGYVLLVIPGIYFNMRVFWADEFALAHRVNPFKALDESWQISRGQAGKTFALEFALGWIMFALALAIVLPLTALYGAVSSIVPDVNVTDAIFAGLGTFLILVAYSLVHSMQIALFHALRARHASAPVAEAHKPMSRLLQWSSVPVAVVVFLFLGFALLIETGNAPSDRVLAGAEVPNDQYEALLAEQIVYADETIEYFYSEGLLSVLEGGSVLTDRRVIAYERNASELIDVYEMYVEDIASIELVQQGDTLNFSIYKVLSRHDDETWMHLFLPHEYGDDRTFVSAIEGKISE